MEKDEFGFRVRYPRISHETLIAVGDGNWNYHQIGNVILSVPKPSRSARGYFSCIFSDPRYFKEIILSRNQATLTLYGKQIYAKENRHV